MGEQVKEKLSITCNYESINKTRMNAEDGFTNENYPINDSYVPHLMKS